MCKETIVKTLRGFAIEYQSRYAVFSVLGEPQLVGVIGIDEFGATAYELSEFGGVRHSQKFAWDGHVSRRQAARLIGFPIELANSIRVRKY